MASGDKTALDYRRADPDETEGRRLYRALADRQARQDAALTRRVRMQAAGDEVEGQVRGIRRANQ
jgi:hypothetical protein